MAGENDNHDVVHADEGAVADMRAGPEVSAAADVKAPVDPMLAPTPVTIACGCRRGRKDPSVIAEPRYSWWATATLLFGVTAPPKSLEYQCLKCRKVIAVETDSETIRRHTF